MSRVVVTGMGLITPLGVGLKHTWKKLIAGNSGLVSTKTFSDYETAGWSKVPSKVVGQVPQGSIKEGKWDVLDHLDAGEARRLALFSQYALSATQEALNDARIDFSEDSDMDKTRVGVAVGSGIGSFPDIYDNSLAFGSSGYKRVQPLFIPKLLNNMAAGNISIKHGLKGPLHSVSTACATGLNSVGDAFNFIKNDYADVMVCGGTEASLHPLALAGFARARSVVTDFEDTPESASRPFDKDRNGFVLSEGCGILILEKLEHALSRGADIYGEVSGYGLCGDAHHITAPEESGEGAYRAMEMAVKRAKVDPSDIGYVNAHATSTVIGDRAENNAIQRLFAGHNDLSVSSTKSSIGHLLGAAGAVEAAFTLMALKTGEIPATLNLDSAGGHKHDDIDKFQDIDYVPNTSRQKLISHALCNSFGFGGVNTSVVFSKYN
ncbi:hypothetical protein OXX69_000945 [Metschnikowia pulcherrima]